jgi:hypothetical protein
VATATAARTRFDMCWSDRAYVIRLSPVHCVYMLFEMLVCPEALVALLALARLVDLVHVRARVRLEVARSQERSLAHLAHERSLQLNQATESAVLERGARLLSSGRVGRGGRPPHKTLLADEAPSPSSDSMNAHLSRMTAQVFLQPDRPGVSLVAPFKCASVVLGPPADNFDFGRAAISDHHSRGRGDWLARSVGVGVGVVGVGLG